MFKKNAKKIPYSWIRVARWQSLRLVILHLCRENQMQLAIPFCTCV